MSDFIREVDEDYRRERMGNFFRRFQVPLALLVVGIIAGAGGWRWYADHRLAQAENADQRYQAAEVQSKTGQAADSEAGFRALAGDGPAGYALLSKIRAAEVLGAQDPEAAAKALDAIASDESIASVALRDLARYRGALLRVDRMDSKAFEAQYGRFALDSFTLHDGMRELLGLAALKREDQTAAGKYFEDILVDPVVPPALRNRAQAYLELVHAGPATAIPAAPGPAAVTPMGKPPASQFQPIAPVGETPPEAGVPVETPAAKSTEPAAPAEATVPKAPETAEPAEPGPPEPAPQPAAPAK